MNGIAGGTVTGQEAGGQKAAAEISADPLR